MSAEGPDRHAGHLDRLLFALGLAATAAWGLGQAARDATWWTALCFYVPSPALAVGLTACGSLLRARRRTRLGWCCLLLALVPAAVTLVFEHRWRRPPAPAADVSLRLVHWNVYRARRGWGPIERALIGRRADLYVLSEPPWRDEPRRLARALGRGYTSRRLGDFAVIARGRLLAIDPVHERWPQVYACTWECAGARLSLLLVDLPSSIGTTRDPMLRHVMRLVAGRRPDLVVGDFNAPRRSRALSRLPPGYVHAYDAAGTGWSYTWPAPCPLWAIDQCIAGPRVEALRYSLGTYLASDHRMQVLRFRLRDARGTALQSDPLSRIPVASRRSDGHGRIP